MTTSTEIRQSVPLCHISPSPEKNSSGHISPSTQEGHSSGHTSPSAQEGNSRCISSNKGDFLYISSKKRLPSGFGSIRYLGKGRRNSYAVHTPSKTIPGEKWIRPPALCYVPDWLTGFKALSLYHASLFEHGLERDPVSLQARFSELLAGIDMTAQEYPTGDILLSNKMSDPYREKIMVKTRETAREETREETSGETREEAREEIREETAVTETSGSVLTFLETILLARNSISNTPGSPQKTQAMEPDSDPVIDSALNQAADHLMDSGTHPALDSGTTSVINPALDSDAILSMDPSMDIAFNEKFFPEGNETNPDREKSYGDLLRSMSLSFGQILKKMKQSENDPAADSSDDNTVNDILQRCMLQGVERLKDLSPENSHMEDYRVETDMQGMVQDENLTLSDMQRTGRTGKDAPVEKSLPPLKDVYRAFYDFKYGSSAAKHLSKSSRCAAAAASRKLAPLFDRTMDEISIMDLQNLVNRTAEAGYSRSAVTDLVTLIRQIYRFAYPRELCSREYGKYVVMPSTVEETHHQDFTDEELRILWKHREDPVINMILIMCYSGFRISEFDPENEMKTVISEDERTGYFQGGMKTRAGKNRIVPIHSAILPLVKKILNRQGQPVFFCGKSKNRFRDDMKTVLTRIGIDTVTRRDTLINLQTDVVPENRYHTPHSCRHTFSRLCESYGVNEADRRRMLGHSFGNDVTNGVYGHRTVRELAIEIEKIKVPK